MIRQNWTSKNFFPRRQQINFIKNNTIKVFHNWKVLINKLSVTYGENKVIVFFHVQ